MQSLEWYWRRLGRMSPAEVAYRARKAAQIWAQRRGFFTARPGPVADELLCAGNASVDLPNVQPEPYVAAADRLGRGEWDVLSVVGVDMGFPPKWNRDVKSGIEAPLTFGMSIDYRDRQLVGDIKYLWEPNRHLELVALIQAYRLTGKESYLEEFRLLLASWFDQCPYLLGPNWSSSLELAIRLINWELCWRLAGGSGSKLFDGDVGKVFQQRWLVSIYQHCHFIAGNLSRYSSANNHLIGELAGLVVAGFRWPYWPDVVRWRNHAMAMLEKEVMNQVAPDGVDREQAISYQQFVLDFLLFAGTRSRAAGQDFSPQYWDRVERMLEFIGSIMDVEGNVPMIGDADDGYVSRLGRERNFCPYRSLLATGGALFGRQDFISKGGGMDDKTRWLLGPQAEQPVVAAAGRSQEPLGPCKRAFPDGGYYLLGSNFGTDREVRVMVDAGPLGLGTLAAHGHADALAFVMYVAGREIFLDPGTFNYQAQGVWRDYFRGTSAHNTVRIDFKNQSEIGGGFMWTRHARAHCEEWEVGDELDRFCGSQDGYRSLPDPVLHRRRLTLNKRAGCLTVEDELQCAGHHDVERWWHFSERCDVTRNSDRTLVATRDGIIVRLSAQEAHTDVELFRGQEEPPAGWVSRSFDVKVPSASCSMRSRIEGTALLVTRIEYEIPAASCATAASMAHSSEPAV